MFGTLRTSLPGSTLRLMTSAGGLVDADRFVGKDSILSGPAGGVIGFSRVAQRAGFEKSIGFDMGGTSTDVSRFDGRYELEFETRKAGVRVVAPMLAIETVAAGGGSICDFDGVKLTVGPDSAGANPGPACYGRGGPLTVTDVNLLLGKIRPEHFPFPLDREAVADRIQALCDRIRSGGGPAYSPIALAEGFVRVANANMVRPIRNISVARGYDPREYALVTFGGAGAQHACAIARELGMRHVLSHPWAGLLSAYGIGLADVRRFREQAVLKPCTAETLSGLEPLFARMEREARTEVLAEGVPDEHVQPPARSLDLRYQGIEATINVPSPADGDYLRRYSELHQQLYGYTHANRAIEITAARVEVVGHMPDPPETRTTLVLRQPEPRERTTTWFEGKPYKTGVFLREQLLPGDKLAGPAIVCEPSSTVVIDPGFTASVLGEGELLLTDTGRTAEAVSTEADPVMLEIFNNLFASIAEQMGITLQRTSLLDEREGTPGLLVRDLRSSRRPRRQRPSHSRASRRDGRDRQTDPGGQSCHSHRRRVRHERPVPGWLAPPGRNRHHPRASRGDGRAAVSHGQPGASRGDRRDRPRQHASLFEKPRRRRRADPQLQAGRRRPFARGRN